MSRLPKIPRKSKQKKARSSRSVPAAVASRNSAPNEIVVASISAQSLSLILANGFTVVASAPTTLIDGVIARLRPPAGLDLETARRRIQQIVPAAVVDANDLYRPVSMPCQKGNCPAFEMVGWAVPPDRCAATATIGMIDTKVNTTHEALRDQSVEIIDVRSKGDRESSASHGTAIAALFVGDENSRTPGLLPDAKLVAVEAFQRDRAGDAADVYKIVRGLDALAQRGIRVVNLSFAGPQNTVLGLAVGAAEKRDIILVAAAGNQGPKAEPAFPGAYNGVFAVTAVDRQSKIYRQAGRGNHIAFAAPGVRLWTASLVEELASLTPIWEMLAAIRCLVGGSSRRTLAVRRRLARGRRTLHHRGRRPTSV
ncbi:MAG: S8 family serine peptidase [Methyloceanibacter sp.]